MINLIKLVFINLSIYPFIFFLHNSHVHVYAYQKHIIGTLKLAHQMYLQVTLYSILNIDKIAYKN